MPNYDKLIAELRSGVNGGDLPTVLTEAANAIETLVHREKALREQVSMFVSQIQAVRRTVAEAMTHFSSVMITSTDIWFSPEAQQHFAEGRIIQTIKQLRDDNPGLGLADAKHFTDALRNRKNHG